MRISITVKPTLNDFNEETQAEKCLIADAPIGASLAAFLFRGGPESSKLFEINYDNHSYLRAKFYRLFIAKPENI